ncbi:MAG: DUF433 domain-containing protein [Anaerolineae bacterium]
MELEQYLDFVAPDDIRIRGHRIGIDDVLYYYREGYSPDEILAQFPSLRLEEIYATITYYLHNRSEVDAYLARLNRWREQRYEESRSNPSPLAERLRAIKAERQQDLPRAS